MLLNTMAIGTSIVHFTGNKLIEDLKQSRFKQFKFKPDIKSLGMSDAENELIQSAIKQGKNIAIIGMLASGKSTILKSLLNPIAESTAEYCILDEVTTQGDIQYINSKITKITPGILFTYHSRTTEELLETFPGLKYHGICIIAERDENSNHTVSVVEV